MTYLTTFNLDCSQLDMKSLNHLGAYHNLIEHLFPEEFKAKTRLRHLWRRDNFKMTVVSETQPSTKILSKYSYRDFAQISNYNHQINNLANNQKYVFKLAANPVLRKRKRVIPLNDKESQLNWLNKKAIQNGFKLDSIKIESVTHPPLKRRKGKGNNNFWLNRVDYHGVLTITDVDKFKKALINGVGRERAFGMGLLLLETRTK